DEGPLDRGVVNVGHADEPAAFERGLPAAAVTETQLADESRVPDVEVMPVADQFDAGKPDHILAFDTQLEDQPVRQVDQVFVEYGLAAEDRGLAVVSAVRIRARIVHAVGVFPLRRATCTQVAVARGGQGLPQPLDLGIETVIGEQETVHGTSSYDRGPYAARICRSVSSRDR